MARKLPKLAIPDFEQYAQETSFAMTGSQTHKQTASTVGKYLHFTAKDGCDIWSNNFDVQKLHEFYKLHVTEYNMSGFPVCITF